VLGCSHVTHGVTTASWTAAGLTAAGAPAAVCMLSIPAGAYAALLPDLDHGSSSAAWSLPPVSNTLSWIIRGCPYSITLPVVGWHRAGWLLPEALTVSTGHRRELHTPEAALAFGVLTGLPLWWLPDPLGSCSWIFGLQVAIGCITHLWGDARTTAGLRRRGGKPGRFTIGLTFDTASDHEHRLRALIYRPTAITSLILSLILISMIGTP
jgi:hypothetical protein